MLICCACAQVAVPLSHEQLISGETLQEKFLSFMHSLLTSNQADLVLVRVFSTLSTLLHAYSPLVWGARGRDSSRCAKWWFELLRHLCYKNIATAGPLFAFPVPRLPVMVLVLLFLFAEAASGFVYLLIHCNYQHVRLDCVLLFS